MSRLIQSLSLLALSAVLSGCLYSSAGSGSTAVKSEPQMASTETSDPKKAAEPIKASGGGPLGGYIEQFMDGNDRTKMTRALDGSLGKSASWTNPVSGANFSVTPLNKAPGGEGICRSYSVTMTKTGVTDRVSGVACIGDDGIWHVSS